MKLYDWDFGVIMGMLLISSFTVYQSYRSYLQDPKTNQVLAKLDERLGTPTWDFSKSWATTITAVGALLATVVSTQGLTHISTQVGLNLFFGMVVLGAPLIYTASAKRLPPNTVGKDNPFQYQGTIRMFLIASTLTLWAVSGELVTVATTLYAMSQSTTASDPFIPSQLTLIVFGCFLLLMIIYTFYYVFKSIPWTLEDQLSDKVSQQYTIEAKKQLLDEAKKPLSEKLSFNYEQSIYAKIRDFTEEDKVKAKEHNPVMKSWSLL